MMGGLMTVQGIVHLAGARFTGGVANFGGAVLLRDGGFLGCTDCEFKRNTATAIGGAIANFGGTLLIRGSNFFADNVVQPPTVPWGGVQGEGIGDRGWPDSPQPAAALWIDSWNSSSSLIEQCLQHHSLPPTGPRSHSLVARPLAFVASAWMREEQSGEYLCPAWRTDKRCHLAATSAWTFAHWHAACAASVRALRATPAAFGRGCTGSNIACHAGGPTAGSTTFEDGPLRPNGWSWSTAFCSPQPSA